MSALDVGGVSNASFVRLGAGQHRGLIGFELRQERFDAPELPVDEVERRLLRDNGVRVTGDPSLERFAFLVLQRAGRAP